MQNPNDVTTQAFDGVVGEISGELGITDKRFYEILARDNYYVKFWQKMGTPLGIAHPDRLELIRIDFEARCVRLIRGKVEPSTPASVHEQISQAMQSILEKAPPAVRRKEIIEAIAELAKELSKCE